jgi:D-beta-D-heptose 7-phosphate kinase / D-beta-D-heptose 1-phosphate adenosyltransferase
MNARADTAAEIVGRARGAGVLVVGDVMVDEYVWGDTARISPDAPVPVVDVSRRSHAAGGAANVAINLAVGGAAVTLVGATGTDVAAATLRSILEERRISVAGLVADPSRRTTLKTRVVARGQQIVRLDEEDRQPLSDATRARVIDEIDAAIGRARVVVVSDYAKGVVDRDLVARCVASATRRQPAIPVVVDPKSTDFSKYYGCYAVTPNMREAEGAARRTIASDEDVAAAAGALHEASGAPFVLVTRGARGMSLSRRDGAVTHIAARAREVFDVTGAGDTVIAYFALGLAGGASPEDAAALANAAAGVAVAKVGTSAVTPQEALVAFAAGAGAPAKLLDRRQAAARAEHERSLGRRVVFTNGCFDLLHAGHLHLLEQSKALGDFLVVAVNSDASVRRLKGPERPLVGEGDRTRLLAALDAVGCVVVFDEDTPLDLIRAVRPDVLVKGGDYTRDTIVGADEVASWGGRVATIPLVAGRSTTALLESIRKAETRS